MSAPYVNQSVLVSTQWVEEHLLDVNVRVVEVDYDPVSNCDLGHAPGAALFDWRLDSSDPVARDIVGKQGYEKLMGGVGMTDGKTLVLYGDFNNWLAARAFWVCAYYGFKNVRLMNGGRKKWLVEDRPVTKEIPYFSPELFDAGGPDDSIRVYMPYVRDSLHVSGKALVDVRGPKKFTGEVLAPLEYPTEHTQRGGRIPGAANIPWGQAVRDDGTFKTYGELKSIYECKGVTPDKEVITYCRIGERSSHNWFVLKYLLG